MKYTRDTRSTCTRAHHGRPLRGIIIQRDAWVFYLSMFVIRTYTYRSARMHPCCSKRKRFCPWSRRQSISAGLRQGLRCGVVSTLSACRTDVVSKVRGAASVYHRSVPLRQETNVGTFLKSKYACMYEYTKYNFYMLVCSTCGLQQQIQPELMPWASCYTPKNHQIQKT